MPKLNRFFCGRLVIAGLLLGWGVGCSQPAPPTPGSVRLEVEREAIRDAVSGVFPLKVNAGFPVELESPQVRIDPSANLIRLSAAIHPLSNILRPAMPPPENPKDPAHAGELVALLEVRWRSERSQLVLGVKEVTSVSLPGVPPHISVIMGQGAGTLIDGALMARVLADVPQAGSDWRMESVASSETGMVMVLTEGAQESGGSL